MMIRSVGVMNDISAILLKLKKKVIYLCLIFTIKRVGLE